MSPSIVVKYGTGGASGMPHINSIVDATTNHTTTYDAATAAAPRMTNKPENSFLFTMIAAKNCSEIERQHVATAMEQ